jgi:hypothetical protein
MDARAIPEPGRTAGARPKRSSRHESPRECFHAKAGVGRIGGPRGPRIPVARSRYDGVGSAPVARVVWIEDTEPDHAGSGYGVDKRGVLDAVTEGEFSASAGIAAGDRPAIGIGRRHGRFQRRTRSRAARHAGGHDLFQSAAAGRFSSTVGGCRARDANGARGESGQSWLLRGRLRQPRRRHPTRSRTWASSIQTPRGCRSRSSIVPGSCRSPHRIPPSVSPVPGVP